MSEENKGVSDVPEEKVTPKEDEQNVSRKAYEEVSKDMHKNKQKAKEQALEINELQAQLKAQDEAKMHEKEQWKELFEKREAELEVERSKAKTQQERYTKSVKVSALKQELGGNVKDEYLSFADLSNISLNDEGLIDSETLRNVANDFRKQHGQLIPSEENTNVTGHAPANDTISKPQSTSGKSAAELVKLYANQKNNQ